MSLKSLRTKMEMFMPAGRLVCRVRSAIIYPTAIHSGNVLDIVYCPLITVFPSRAVIVVTERFQPFWDSDQGLLHNLTS